MAQEGKLDLLLKTLEDSEKKRAEVDEQVRADMAELLVAVEARIPQVEKRMDDLGKVLGSLSLKVEKLESSVLLQARFEKATRDGKPELGEASPSQSTLLIHGTRDPILNSSQSFGYDGGFGSPNGAGSSPIASSLPPMSCPQFSGDNPQMWRANCEVYFDVYGIPANTWVKVATLNFVGNVAFWLQSVRNQLIGITWHDLCERLCARFTRDRQ